MYSRARPTFFSIFPEFETVLLLRGENCSPGVLQKKKEDAKCQIGERYKEQSRERESDIKRRAEREREREREREFFELWMDIPFRFILKRFSLRNLPEANARE